MDCSLWKVLPSLPAELSLPAIGQPNLDWRIWRRPKVRSDSDDRYGLLIALRTTAASLATTGRVLYFPYRESFIVTTTYFIHFNNDR
jgi:hypothetical protein